MQNFTMHPDLSQEYVQRAREIVESAVIHRAIIYVKFKAFVRRQNYKAFDISL